MSSQRSRPKYAAGEGALSLVPSQVLREAHTLILQKYGGLHGVRDENALESAVARPSNLVYYSEVTSVPLLAASLSWAIVRSHPFVDGNKRTGLAALLIFLERNGFRLTCSQAEEAAMVLRVAAGELTEEHWSAWVQTVASPR